MEFAVLGIDQETYELAVILECTPLGTQSRPLNGTDMPSDGPVFSDYEEAAKIADRAIRMDQRYWPPVSPVMAEVEGGRVSRLLASGVVADDITAAGQRWNLPVELVP